MAENHILFRPPRLKRWLYYEQAEIEMTEKILTGVDGISFLTDGQHWNPRLVSDKKYVLIVLVPGLNEMKCVRHSVDNGGIHGGGAFGISRSRL